MHESESLARTLFVIEKTTEASTQTKIAILLLLRRPFDGWNGGGERDLRHSARHAASFCMRL
jgi:hypothetical protein